MKEDITNRDVEAKVVEAANKIINQNKDSLERIKRMIDYLDVNESNVRSIHKMVHDMKEDIKILQVRTNRIEEALEKLLKT